MSFLAVQPSASNRWRAIVLFGRNVASYKFALGQALFHFKDASDGCLPLEELALPYALSICEHLKTAPKQATSASSRFLDRCRAYNIGAIDEEALRGATVKLGFVNVLDAFHRVGSADLEARFFIDERRETGGIRITDEFREMTLGRTSEDLQSENEARWRLVETAWELGISRSLIEYDCADERLKVRRGSGRVGLTSVRPALNGYQKGKCFYCSDDISIAPTQPTADVDHFFPLSLHRLLTGNLNGVWNLVLACRTCNRGARGKFDAIPAFGLLDRLHRRNEFLITSHHPLRETLMSQTGLTLEARLDFLRSMNEQAVLTRIATWLPERRGDPVF